MVLNSSQSSQYTHITLKHKNLMHGHITKQANQAQAWAREVSASWIRKSQGSIQKYKITTNKKNDQK